eukprot:scaffold95428_cov53-Cyclotella_meneghiniana.AAC.1
MGDDMMMWLMIGGRKAVLNDVDAVRLSAANRLMDSWQNLKKDVLKVEGTPYHSPESGATGNY